MDEDKELIEESKDTEIPEQLHLKLSYMIKAEQNKRKREGTK